MGSKNFPSPLAGLFWLALVIIGLVKSEESSIMVGSVVEPLYYDPAASHGPEALVDGNFRTIAISYANQNPAQLVASFYRTFKVKTIFLIAPSGELTDKQINEKMSLKRSDTETTSD